MNKNYRSTYKSQSLIALAFNVFIRSLAGLVVSGDKKIVTHCGISRFFLKTIFCILADETYQLIASTSSEPTPTNTCSSKMPYSAAIA